MFELVLRIGFSLLVVFGLMWLLAKVVRRPLGGGHGAGELAVLHRRQVGRGSAVAVVQVADRALIIGVTDQQVSLLGETELAAFGRDAAGRRDPVPLEPGAVSPVPTGPGPADPVVRPGPLHGSLLSPRTWGAALEFLRERTTRQ